MLSIVNGSVGRGRCGSVFEPRNNAPPRVPTPTASHVAIASGVNHRVTSPRWTSARSYAGQFPTRYFVVYLGCTLDFTSRSCPFGRHDGQGRDEHLLPRTNAALDGSCRMRGTARVGTERTRCVLATGHGTICAPSRTALLWSSVAFGWTGSAGRTSTNTRNLLIQKDLVPLAQLAEHLTLSQQVVSSSLTAGSSAPRNLNASAMTTPRATSLTRPSHTCPRPLPRRWWVSESGIRWKQVC